ncbi:hypothetical protein HO133_004900 [Letharia lupina]|uniref:Uncharacterized protein n=1 Tax=Letharia lupina TaxID=560253 RepID=A0A8H6FL44_9LECA|nr:uncharacterized protein HO133_004900 [Letharia lupina]KAF6230556.1 hypothetical protein HO133_004900 [Letharia lupina]
MAGVLRNYVGFERIRITVRLRPYEFGGGGRVPPFDWEIVEERREDYIKEMDKRLGPWLGPADCMNLGDGTTTEGQGDVVDSMVGPPDEPRDYPRLSAWNGSYESGQ